ncbi:hypothetical protein [Anabaena subtropica]|uniref:Uncharacterized protein n=1 Tax=Anabaena subtropica FACHB-260 TaxID=2692884 RepID=A0ABR8CKT8_9NOST|nr:hypothetical protein [Anabaena subtropica]MBD2343115.1 hypothetical protein [Anabaena subtropica FACHB-260]
MSNQMLVSNLLEDLSLDQQQSLAGGQWFEDGEGEGESETVSGASTGETRRYRVRSVGIISVRKLSS